MTRARIFLVSSLVLGAGLSGFLAACGGDDTVVSGTDAGGDASKPDGSPNPFDGSPGIDGSVFDGGGGVDGGDGGIALTFKDFLSQEATVFCQRATFCCAGLDAGVVNNAKCIAAVQQNGFFDHAFPGTDILNDDAGAASRVTVNQASAQQCLNTLGLAACTLGATLNNQILSACTDSFDGTQATGGACKFSLECKQPAYCKFNGGVGTCQPIEAVGGDCSKVNPGYPQPLLGQDACTSRRYGNPLAFCDYSNQTDGGTNTCQLPLGEGADCIISNQCQANLACDQETGQCAKQGSLLTPDICSVIE